MVKQGIPFLRNGLGRGHPCTPHRKKAPAFWRWLFVSSSLWLFLNDLARGTINKLDRLRYSVAVALDKFAHYVCAVVA